MIRAVPESVFSWRFRFEQNGQQVGGCAYNFWTEEGEISINGRHGQIKKHGMMSGRWTVDGTGIEAHKPSALFRSFDIQSPQGNFELRAASPLTREFEIVGAGINGQISPEHFMTRKATIALHGVDEMTVAFAFWLVGLCWKRQAKNNS